MDTTYDFDTAPNRAQDGSDRIVYVRPVNTADLPEEVQEEIESELPGLERLFAVHNADGERLALVRDRDMAFVLARENDLAPVTVH
ncbi:DUF1150 family protein [Pseudooceanicola algae]|uniref:DUF1150 domain-containing protein n=1 Tax=Pseudooceanicola algae TaxID=1537215 RepID=A0A418SIH7_9RHOB|nr:DUF1150 family protein [Pseudooceanicola algae]QPM92137.1 hypothetical protein PSAL_034000 [Pseudooceanicola algae]